MKQLITIFSTILFLMSCSGIDSGIIAKNGLSTDNISIIERFTQAVQNKNGDAISVFLSDDYNGKITLSRILYDEADALRQLSYEFMPPAE
jgi:hypothetical protein